MRRIVLALAANALIAPAFAPAFAAPVLTPPERYVRYRAAAAAGQIDRASAEMATLLGEGGTSDEMAKRAYRQGVAGGDHSLAVRAARLLDAQKALPPDGPVLFAIDAIRAGDWKSAREQTARLDEGKLFAFLTPLLAAWIAEGSHAGDPIALIEAARAQGMAATYVPSEKVLLLVAAGRVDEAVAALRAQPGAGSRLKILVAGALEHAHRRADALAVLSGDEQAVVAAHARLAAGGSIGTGAAGVGPGVSELLAQLAIDFARQRLSPVAMVIARLATFADPDNSSAWISIASLLGEDRKQAAGLAALANVRADDPFAQDAKTLRVSLLLDAGDKEGALKAALAAAQSPAAEATDLARAGDVYLALNRPGDAAAIYTRAIAMVPAGATEPLWPLLLQQGSALEQAGDWPGAKQALTKAAALAPNQPSALNHLGYSLLSRREDVARATALINQAQALRPDDPAITDSQGWAHFVVGDIKGALPLLETAAQADPADPTINEHLGDVYWSAGRRVEARYAWRAATVGAEKDDLMRLRTKLQDGLTKATASP
jgi:tetratricopeptide (TPR) repeat protein